MLAPPSILALFDVGGTEVLLIMLVTLLLFGSKRMPDLARGLGKSIREFKKATSGLEEELKRAIELPPEPSHPRQPTNPTVTMPGSKSPPPAAPDQPSPPTEEHPYP
jgi:sec-independent protein translocase protein TatA